MSLPRTFSLCAQFGQCLLLCLLVYHVFPLPRPFCCCAYPLSLLSNFLVLRFPFRIYSISLLRLSIFSFVAIMFVIACGSVFVMAALESLPDNSNASATLLSTSLGCLFSLSLRSAWFLV